MDTAVKQLAADILAGVGTARRQVAGHILHALLAMTLDRDANIAWRAGTRVTADLASVVLAVFVLLLVTVLAAGVREYHRVVLGFFVPAAEALILRHGAFRISELTVRACPVVKGEEALLSAFLLLLIVVAMVNNDAPLFLFLVLTDVLLEGLVEFHNPALHTA